MKALTLSVSALALLMLVSPARAEDGSYSATTKVEQNADGDFKKETKEEATTVDGTKQVTTSEEKVDVKNDGSSKATITTESTVDPEGLNNKATSETKETVKKEADGDLEAKTVTESKANGGSTDKVESKTSVKNDKHGKKTVKTETKVHDPKGLMNKTTEKTVDTTVEKVDGTVEVEHEKTVDGKTVVKTEDKVEPAPAH